MLELLYIVFTEIPHQDSACLDLEPSDLIVSPHQQSLLDFAYNIGNFILDYFTCIIKELSLLQRFIVLAEETPTDVPTINQPLLFELASGRQHSIWPPPADSSLWVTIKVNPLKYFCSELGVVRIPPVTNVPTLDSMGLNLIPPIVKNDNDEVIYSNAVITGTESVDNQEIKSNVIPKGKPLVLIYPSMPSLRKVQFLCNENGINFVIFEARFFGRLGAYLQLLKLAGYTQAEAEKFMIWIPREMWYSIPDIKTFYKGVKYYYSGDDHIVKREPHIPPTIVFANDPVLKFIVDYRYLVLPEIKTGFNMELVRLLCKIPSHKFIEQNTPELLKFTPSNDLLSVSELIKSLASKINLNLYLHCSSRVSRNLEVKLELIAALNALGAYPYITSQFYVVFL